MSSSAGTAAPGPGRCSSISMRRSVRSGPARHGDSTACSRSLCFIPGSAWCTWMPAAPTDRNRTGAWSAGRTQWACTCSPQAKGLVAVEQILQCVDAGAPAGARCARSGSPVGRLRRFIASPRLCASLRDSGKTAGLARRSTDDEDLIDSVTIRPAAAPCQLWLNQCLPRGRIGWTDLLAPQPASGEGTNSHLMPSFRE